MGEGEKMSKMSRLEKGVTQYPAVGNPCVVKVWDSTARAEKTYWLGHVWTSERTGTYLRPRARIDEAKLDAINAVVAIKKEN